ncbi:selenium cofactor biosynthesis protein YqeC [Salarchaeum sp. JOR-1]|uniref:selenium cofactor biosynthesis protein YqeC n=1 Tax=Salarchaeum sp. JOR-1 TaxID=2599399 RepID=UPI0011987973|nr:selenium cofactor biosynthesis protein YqeC [Salarchaeum sp. JOR-1]QDX41406.1 putative selenium-dependent hydroxylase accessory protein YqeC [Salarchaeum sp. JOR-1]
MELSDALAARGLVAVVGAGGKKTTLYALADRLDRAVVTATVRIPPFAEHVTAVHVADDPRRVVDAATDFPVGVVRAQERADRYRGFDTETVADLRECDVDAVLVKADGARMRDFKAPAAKEPQIPSNADTVLPVASVQAVGEPLDDALVHRPERVAALTDLAVGDTIEPEHVARVLAHPDGGLKDVPADATVVPVLNKVDDDASLAVARSIAGELHDRAAVERVALTSHVRDDPLVDVV